MARFPVPSCRSVDDLTAFCAISAKPAPAILTAICGIRVRRTLTDRLLLPREDRLHARAYRQPGPTPAAPEFAMADAQEHGEQLAVGPGLQHQRRTRLLQRVLDCAVAGNRCCSNRLDRRCPIGRL